MFCSALCSQISYVVVRVTCSDKYVRERGGERGKRKEGRGKEREKKDREGRGRVERGGGGERKGESERERLFATKSGMFLSLWASCHLKPCVRIQPFTSFSVPLTWKVLPKLLAS